MDSKAKPYILGYLGNREGNGYYRLIEPLRAAKDAGLVFGRLEDRVLTTEAVLAMRPSAVVWQMQMQDHLLETMKDYHRAGVFQVYEVDDLILSKSDIADSNIHKGKFPSDLKARWRKILSFVDRVTVPTEPLAAYYRDLGVDVRVVPNAIPRRVLDAIQAKPFSAEKLSSSYRPRIGWMGGIGHAGDLAVLAEVVELLGDTVQWVFMGMVPPGVTPEKVEVIPPAPVEQHLLRWAQADIDLALAPLERSAYNECKSNLRVLEYGACGFPVLATKIAPYADAPVFFPESDTASAWAAKIRELVSDLGALHESGLYLRAWVERHFTLEDRAPAFAAAWGADIASTWDASLEAQEAKGYWVGHEALCVIPKGLKARSEAYAAAHPEVAAISFLSNDGDYAAYPMAGQFVPINAEISERIQDVVHRLELDPLELPVPVGPLTYITPVGEARIGALDVTLPLVSGQLMDFGAKALSLGLKTVLLPEFVGALFPQERDEQKAASIAQGFALRYPGQEKLFDKDAEVFESLRVLRANIEAEYNVRYYQITPAGRSPADAYDLWLDAYMSGIPADCEEVSVVHIGSDAPLPDTRYVCFTQPTDTFLPGVYGAVRDAPMAYCDEDTANGAVRSNPYCKPAWNYTLLLSHNYLGRGVRLRTDDLREMGVTGAPASEYEYADLLFRVVERFDGHLYENADRFIHVPEIGLTKTAQDAPYIYPVGDHIKRRSRAAMVNVLPNRMSFVQWAMEAQPRVEIGIPTKDNAGMLDRCVGSILRFTSYPSYHITIFDNGSRDKETLRLLAQMEKHEKITVKRVPLSPFNYSTVNNRGFQGADADYFLLMNDDVEVLPNGGHWLDLMLRTAQDDQVGVVGAKLLYANRTVQHVGVVTGMGFVADHKFKGIGAQDFGYFGQAVVPHEVSAVTGACLLVSKPAWDAVGGLDERYAVAYGDVDFCTKCRTAGYKVVIQPQAALLHHESVSRGLDDTPEKLARHLGEARTYRETHVLESDPFWSPLLALSTQPALAWPPRSYTPTYHGGVFLIGANPEMERQLSREQVRWVRFEMHSPTTLRQVLPQVANAPLLNLYDTSQAWFRQRYAPERVVLCTNKGLSLELLHWLLYLREQGVQVEALAGLPEIPFASTQDVCELWEKL
ncbi:glycosyltransferase [Candidatus Igneacidithiobacillus taiwanensis]|uniref:glycosyltransferase n=1 Tax=Candidatus Igneacidithiobacillus taiwanensis TaxID=1945924 RepID=UPI0028974489|nr:glycosyltransferase [Candidatus Igneacidithiobacillus taiwanensis]